MVARASDHQGVCGVPERNPVRSSPSAAAAGRAPSISAISPSIQPKPGVISCSRPRSAISCMPTQMPRNGVPAAVARLDRLAHAGNRGQSARAVGEGALARQHDPVGAGDIVGIRGHPHLGIQPGALRRQRERPRGGGQIAAAVVHHRDLHRAASGGRKLPSRSGRRSSSRPSASISLRADDHLGQQIAAMVERPAAQVVAGQAEQHDQRASSAAATPSLAQARRSGRRRPASGRRRSRRGVRRARAGRTAARPS